MPARRRSRAPWLLVLLWLFAAVPALAQDFPPLTGRVVDTADLLGDTAEAELSGLLAGHESATTNQVVVVTVPDLGGYDIADYGFQLGRHWGIGQEGKDNGVLLIVARDDRKVRIEVGYGLEGALTDAQSKLIIENTILPAFKEGDYEGGIRAGLGAMLTVLNGEALPAEIADSGQEDELPGWAVILIVVGVVIFFLFMSTVGRRRGWVTTSGGWSSGGGSSGGGGFSGGGGSFGGGGASGGW